MCAPPPNESMKAWSSLPWPTERELNVTASSDPDAKRLGFALLGLSFGQSSGALSSNFQPRHRYTGSAFTSDLAWLFGAGFAPMVALWLSSQFGLIAAGAYLLSGAIGTLVALWLNRELASTIG